MKVDSKSFIMFFNIQEYSWYRANKFLMIKFFIMLFCIVQFYGLKSFYFLCLNPKNPNIDSNASSWKTYQLFIPSGTRYRGLFPKALTVASSR